MKLYEFKGDPATITPAQFEQSRDFDSYLGDEKLVAKPGGVRYGLLYICDWSVDLYRGSLWLLSYICIDTPIAPPTPNLPTYNHRPPTSSCT